jgi:NAD(P)-dependent dehydrogenase (short-subunit alcohol dehydrogenase family)
MMKLTQPRVDPLSPGIDLASKTAIVTGASQGMGFEITKQLLQLRISTVILAVRNVAKGNACAERLRRDPRIRSNNPKAAIQVMQLDMDRYDSVQAFAKRVREEVPMVDLLILNAGIGLIKLERSPSEHERTTQVNYYSNVLLVAELLPHLQASAEKTGTPARISWVGSRRHLASSIEPRFSSSFFDDADTDKNVLAYLDKEESFLPYQRYSDSKLLCVLFMYTIAPRLDPNKVIINMMCPGMVNTSMSDVLPLHLRLVMNVIKAIRARSAESGAWIVLHSALVEGAKSHGRFLIDKTIVE